MNGRIKTSRRLGAEDKKPKTSGDCAREENRASYAVCFDKAQMIVFYLPLHSKEAYANAITF